MAAARDVDTALIAALKVNPSALPSVCMSVDPALLGKKSEINAFQSSNPNNSYSQY